jgi:Protein of unknown function (DUF667)
VLLSKKIPTLDLVKVKNGNIKRVTDCDLKSSVVELSGVNVATTFISTPTKQHCSLAIRLPFLVMLVKNMRKYFCFQVQVGVDTHWLRETSMSSDKRFFAFRFWTIRT